MSDNSNSVLDRVLGDIAAATDVTKTTDHSTYTSGVFEDDSTKSSTDADNSVLDRVLGDIAAAASATKTTDHSTYTSGVFEDDSARS